MHRLKNALNRLLGIGTDVRSRGVRRLAPLQELEDRCLLSVTPVGAESRVNTHTQGAQQTFSQTRQAVAMDPAGDYVVVWSSQGQNAGGGWDTYFQRYNAAGVAQGGETLAGAPVNGVNQLFASLAMNPSGSFVVSWSSDQGGRWNVYAQRFDAAGNKVGSAFQVNAASAADQAFSTVAMDSAGNFVVTWSGQQSGNWDVYAQRYDSAGNALGSNLLVNTTTANDQEYAAIAMAPTGSFVITWSGSQSGNWDVYGQMFTSSGARQGSEFQVNTTTTNDQLYSSVAMDASGNFTITWSGRQSGHWNVYAQSYNAGGTLNSGEFQVNPSTSSDQEYSSVAYVGGNNLVFTWSSNNQDGSGWGVYAQQCNTSGNLQGSELLVNTHTQDNQVYSSIDGNASGNLTVVWSSHNQNNVWDVYGQQFSIGASAAGLFALPSTALQTSETGTSASFSLSLYSTPTAPVTVNFSLSDPTQGTLSRNSLTFTLNNWNVAQTVTVTGLDDHIVHGDQTYQINGTASSGDNNYQQLAMTPVTVVNKEADVAGISVTGSTFLVAVDNNVIRINSLTGAVVATYPTGVPNDGSTFGPDGSIYVADYFNHRILHYGAAGNFLSSFGSGQLNSPQGLAFGPDGNLYVTDTSNWVKKFSPAGAFLGTFITAGSGGLSNAKAIVWGPDGDAYVSSYFNSEVLRYDGTTGAFLNVFATGSGGFEDLTFGPDNNLYVASYGDNQIYRYRGTDGTSLGAFASGPPLVNPYGLRFDPAGNLDVTNRSSGTIQTFDGTTGAFLHSLAAGLTNPAYLTMTSSLVTTEMGASASFMVALTSQPTAAVTINLATSVPGQGSLSQSTLTFDAGNWNIAQTVTVTGLDDLLFNGDQQYQITGTATSTDTNYSSRAMPSVSVVNREADSIFPAANNDSFNTNVNTPLIVAAPGLLGNDTRPPGLPLTAIRISGPSHGALTLHANGSFTYTPNANYLGFDSFTYRADEGLFSSNVATVSLAVNSLPPVANNDSFSTNVNTPLNVTVSGVLANDTDPQGRALSSVLVSGPSHGSLTLNATGSFTYTANANYYGPDSFTYRANDGVLNSNVATVSLTVNSLPPVANNDSFSTNVNTPLNVAASGVLTNDSDSQARPLNAILVSGPSNGSLALNANGSFTYTPNANYFGSDGFTYRANDGLMNSNVATVSLTVNSLPPVANNDSFSTNVNTPLNVAASGVLANDTDPQGRALSSVLVSGPVHGSLTLNATGSFSYVANANYYGLDSFTYRANDGLANSNIATVSLTVNSLPPVANNDSFTTNVNTALNVAASGVLANDTDPQARPLTAILVIGPSHGSLTLAGDGAFRYRPSANFTGNDSFTYMANNGLASSNVAAVSLTVNGVPGVTVTPTALQTSKAGASAFFNVVLTSQPTNPVTINLSSTNPAEGLLSSSSLTFGAGNWYVAQTVTVTGLNDGMVNGNQTYQIHGTTFSFDGHYNGLPVAPVTVTNVDTNTAGFIVNPTALTTSESGTGATFSIALATQPLFPVTVNLINGNPVQGTLSRGSLTFTLLNWSVPHSVTVTGLDDHIVHGDQTYQITGVASSSDMNYRGLHITPISVTNAEADVAGFTVTRTSLTTSESGTSASFGVGLTSRPLAPVTITLANGNPTQGSLSQTSLTFDPTSWGVAQNVTVTGLDDRIVNANQTYQITGTAASTDAIYNNLAMTPITVTNIEAAGQTAPKMDVTLHVSVVIPPSVSASRSTTPPLAMSVLGLLVSPPAVSTNLVNAGPNIASNATIQASEPAHAQNIAVPAFSARATEATVAGAVSTPIQLQPENLHRIVQVVAPIPRVAWQEPVDVQPTSVMPAEPLSAFETIPISLAMSPSQLRNRVVQADVFLDVLNEAGERLAWTEGARESTALISTGIIATTGYVLLNTRVGLWMLSLLTSQPLWRQFDPLEVLYAWEDESKTKGQDADEEETLVSLVD